MNNIKGFLHTEGKQIVNGAGEPIILTGWGLGNWLLQEGYMWLSGESRFDRPRRIEQVIEELTGKEYADQFWKRYRRDYIRREDILYLAELGYNSVRIPMHWRLLMEEGPGIVFKEEGFSLLEHCLDWCEEAGIYAFLDLHGAPGGQTGANIDDSVDNVPRLFTDAHNKEKALALWKELAVRFGGREVVGGYDLLNEPIAPENAGYGNRDYLIPELEQFYRDAIALIREVDSNHLFSFEGPHWATETCIFHEKYDDNMVLHFHRYAENPERKILDAYLAKSEEWNIPLWLGETGENLNEWYAALYPLSASLGIGYNLWTFKKMNCTNSPCSINTPADYELLLNYTKGGSHPGFEKARSILDEYLNNIRLENCTLHPEITNHVFRQAPFTLRATDFDEIPGKGISFSGVSQETPEIAYREGCGMKLLKTDEGVEKRFAFDCGWDSYALVLSAGEFAEYTLMGKEAQTLFLTLSLWGESNGILTAEIKGGAKEVLTITPGTKTLEAALPLSGEGSITLRVTVNEGQAGLTRLSFHTLQPSSRFSE